MIDAVRSAALRSPAFESGSLDLMDLAALRLLSAAQLDELLVDGVDQLWDVDYDATVNILEKLTDSRAHDFEIYYDVSVSDHVFGCYVYFPNDVPESIPDKTYAVCLEVRGDGSFGFPPNTRWTFRRVATLLNCEIGYTSAANGSLEAIILYGLKPEDLNPAVVVYVIIRALILRKAFPLVQGLRMRDLSFSTKLTED